MDVFDTYKSLFEVSYEYIHNGEKLKGKTTVREPGEHAARMRVESDFKHVNASAYEARRVFA